MHATFEAGWGIMIVIRRFLALLLIPVFLLLFLATLLVFRVNDTLLEASFYSDSFETLDVFNFVYDEGIPFAIEDAVARGTFDPDDVPFGIDVTPAVVTARVKAVLPPAWLEENVIAVIDAAVPYLAGETDEFSIGVPLDERIEAATVVIKEMILDAAIHQYIVDTVIEEQLAGKDAIEGLPYGLTVGKAQIVDGIERVVPEDWLKDQLTAIIDEVTPYVLGRSDTFTVTIPLQARAAAGIEVVDDWVATSLDGGAYDYLLESQIAPVAQNTLGSVVELPYGVTFTNAEVVAAIGQVLPSDWVAARVSDAIGEFGPYITGETDSFTLVVPLADRAEAAAVVLVDTADAKFESIYNALPACTVAQLGSLNLTLDALPECRPPIISYQQLKGVVGLDVLEQLVVAIVEPLPDEIAITDAQIFAAVADVAPVEIDDVRKILRDGYTFTEVDLSNLILEQASTPQEGADILNMIEDVRGYMRGGFNFTEADLQERLGANVNFALFDDIRGYVGLGREYVIWLVLLPLLIAFLIGVLGGRWWGSRLAWMGVPLLIAGGLAAVALGPVAAVGFEIGDDYIRESVNPAFVEKALETRVALQDSFLAPMALQSTAAAAVGLGMIVVGIIFGRRRRPRRVATGGRTWETQAAHESREMLDELKEDLKED